MNRVLINGEKRYEEGYIEWAMEVTEGDPMQAENAALLLQRLEAKVNGHLPEGYWADLEQDGITDCDGKKVSPEDAGLTTEDWKSLLEECANQCAIEYEGLRESGDM